MRVSFVLRAAFKLQFCCACPHIYRSMGNTESFLGATIGSILGGIGGLVTGGLAWGASALTALASGYGGLAGGGFGAVVGDQIARAAEQDHRSPQVSSPGKCWGPCQTIYSSARGDRIYSHVLSIDFAEVRPVQLQVLLTFAVNTQAAKPLVHFGLVFKGDNMGIKPSWSSSRWHSVLIHRVLSGAALDVADVTSNLEIELRQPVSGDKSATMNVGTVQPYQLRAAADCITADLQRNFVIQGFAQNPSKNTNCSAFVCRLLKAMSITVTANDIVPTITGMGLSHEKAEFAALAWTDYWSKV